MAGDNHSDGDERERDERRPSDGWASAEQGRDGHAGGQSARTLPEPLLDVVADPAQGRHRLPYLLGLLDGDDAHVRLTAATAVCLVAESAPELWKSVVRRLADRLDGDTPEEAAHALGYLASRDPDTVDEVVSELDDETERRVRDRLTRHGSGFVRSEYLTPSRGGKRVGRARLAGGSAGDDPRRVYANDAEADPRDDEPIESDRRADDGEDIGAGDSNGGERGAEAGATASDDDNDDGAGDDRENEDGASDDDENDGRNDASGDDRSIGVTGSGADAGRQVTRGTLALVSKRLSAVVEASEFDELRVLSGRRRGRYGDEYRTVGTDGNEEYAVALTVYRLSDEDRGSFVVGFRDAMDAWCDVHDHRAILSVYDWGTRPRPWAALDYADATLASREDRPPVLGTALELASAVAYAHQRGVVHGAIDPGNVAYHDTALTEEARRLPKLTNVGLAVETGTAAPGVGVDPRYAAPEHYDESYGRVDHATDVYGLGVLLYRLCTGRHPFADAVPSAAVEGADALRERVLSASFPEPTSVNPNLPRSVDQIVAKATATRKLKRYETVTQFERELRSLGETGASGDPSESGGTSESRGTSESGGRSESDEAGPSGGTN